MSLIPTTEEGRKARWPLLPLLSWLTHLPCLPSYLSSHNCSVYYPSSGQPHSKHCFSKLDVMECACNPGAHKVKAGRSQIQVEPSPHSKTMSQVFLLCNFNNTDFDVGSLALMAFTK